jgi:DNA-binding LytR/AlgR family response regulator
VKRLNCIIVDDEPGARKILQEFVGQVPFLELLGKFENAKRAEAFLKLNGIELIFLDIEMPKLSGLNWLQQSNHESMVILTTAFPEYALEGYEFDIVDYLLKPIAFSRFLKAVHKAKEYYQLKHTASELSRPSYIFIKSDKRIEKISLDEISFAESLGNYVSIHTQTKKVIAYLTIRSLESQLPAPDFIKIHQSFLVNCSKIEAIEGNEIKIAGKSLPISRKNREMVMNIIQQRTLRR